MKENSGDSILPKRLDESDDMLIIELDERLEFGGGVIDTDMVDADAFLCGTNGAACVNGTACDKILNGGLCWNNGCC